MRDHTRKVMKDALALKNKEIDDWGLQIDQLQTQVQAAKDHRDVLRAERDLIKADLDAEPEVPVP